MLKNMQIWKLFKLVIDNNNISTVSAIYYIVIYSHYSNVSTVMPIAVHN